MFYIRKLLQLDLAKEITSLPMKNTEKLILFLSLYVIKLLNAVKRKLNEIIPFFKRPAETGSKWYGTISSPERLLLSHRNFNRLEAITPPGNLLIVGPYTDEAVEAAKSRTYNPVTVHLPERMNSTFTDQEVSKLPWPAKSKHHTFDLITLHYILDSIEDPLSLIETARQFLKTSGILSIIVTNGQFRESINAPMYWTGRCSAKPVQDIEKLCHVTTRCNFELIDTDIELSSGIGYVGALMAMFRSRNFVISDDDNTVFIRADGARGDTLLATPVIKYLLEHYKKHKLIVATSHPSLLEHFPEIVTVAATTKSPTVNSFRARYETDPSRHFLEVIFKACRLPQDYPEELIYEVSEQEYSTAAKLVNRQINNIQKIVSIHPMTGSRIKRWAESKWLKLAELLQEINVEIILLGSSCDSATIPETNDLRDRLTLRQSLAVISKTDLYIGLDSFLAHGAGALNIPRIILFGSTDPARVLCNIESCPTRVIEGNCPFLHCRQNCTADMWLRNVICVNRKNHCLDSISAEDVFTEAKRMLESK